MSEEKSIDTLVEDIYSVVQGVTPLTAEEIDKAVEEFKERVGDEFKNFLTQTRGESKSRPEPRLSSMGVSCARKHWYRANDLPLDQPFTAPTYIKFFYGHLLEQFLMVLVKLSGHSVSGEQDEVSFQGVTGHRDGVVSGHTIDCKSAASHSFAKIQRGQILDDPFLSQYVAQLWAYSASDGKRSGDPAILAIDKQLGKICLTKLPYRLEDITKLRREFDERKEILQSDEIPERGHEPVDHNKKKPNGNKVLPIQCSYCDYKKRCWPEAREFLYSSGPVYFTHVEKEPNVEENLRTVKF